MSALSNMVRPCSRQTSTIRVASSACVEPQPASPPLPPNVPVPKLNPGTEKPERPNKRYSMCRPPNWDAGNMARRVRNSTAFAARVFASAQFHLLDLCGAVFGNDGLRVFQQIGE